MKIFKVIISGSRDFNNFNQLVYYADKCLKNKKDCRIIIITSDSKGTDRLAEMYAFHRHYELVKVPTNWVRWHKAAAFKRNVEMAEKANALIAFWDGKSKGTSHLIEVMRGFSKPRRIIYYKSNRYKLN